MAARPGRARSCPRPEPGRAPPWLRAFTPGAGLPGRPAAVSHGTEAAHGAGRRGQRGRGGTDRERGPDRLPGVGRGRAAPGVTERADDVQPAAALGEVVRLLGPGHGGTRVGHRAEHEAGRPGQAHPHRPARPGAPGGRQPVPERVGEQFRQHDRDVVGPLPDAPAVQGGQAEVAGRPDGAGVRGWRAGGHAGAAGPVRLGPARRERVHRRGRPGHDDRPGQPAPAHVIGRGDRPS